MGARRALLAVAALALALRLGALLRRGEPGPLTGDAGQYSAYARSLLERGEFADLDGKRAGRMPGYPLFMAAVYGAGGSIRAVLLAQCLLGTGTCVLLFLLARRLLEEPWALACAAAAAVSYDLIAADVSPLSESLYAFLLTAGFAALYRGGALAPAAAGGLFGLAYLVRPEILPYAGLALAASPWWLPGTRVRHAAGGLACLTLVVGAWTARNFAALGTLIPASTMGGETRYMALRHAAEDLGFRSDPRFVPSASLPELERTPAYRERHAELAAELGPGRLARARLYNLLAVYYPFLPAYDATYGALVPLWLCGLWLALRRRDWPPVALLPLALSAVYVFFGGPASRYRFGFAPFLILTAGLGAQELARRATPRRLRVVAGAWLALNAVIWLWWPVFRSGALTLKRWTLGA